MELDIMKAQQPMPIDKDGTVRMDYWIRVEPWEDGEYVITLGGVPKGITISNLRDAKLVRDWLISYLPVPSDDRAQRLDSALRAYRQFAHVLLTTIGFDNLPAQLRMDAEQVDDSAREALRYA